MEQDYSSRPATWNDRCQPATKGHLGIYSCHCVRSPALHQYGVSPASLMLVVEPKLILPFCSIYTEPSMGLLNWIEKPLIWQPLFLAFSFLFLIPLDTVLHTG